MKKNLFLINLFLLLNKQQIKYCVLRNYKSLPNHTNGSDIDLWISSQDIDRFYSVLSIVQKRTHSHLVSLLKDKHCPKVCYLNPKEGCQIDIFQGDIYYQSSVMIPEKCIKQNITHYNEIAILNDSFANIIALLKEIINNGTCDDKYIIPIFQNKETYSKQYLQINLSLFSSDFIDRLYIAIKEENINSQFYTLCQTGKKSINKQNIQLNRLKKLNRLFESPGYTIAVLGTDGSGKSTIINAITPILNEAFHKSIIYNHLRPNVIPELGVLLGKKEKSNIPTVVTNPHALKPSGLIGSIIRWGYYMIDYTFGYLKTVFPLIHTKSKVFIFDRYYYDYYIDQRRSRTSLPYWILRFGEYFVPTPNLTLCLGGDPEKIYARKPETSLEEVTRQNHALKYFCKRHKKAVWVDTTTTLEESIQAVMTAIVNMMKTRFEDSEFK